MPHKWYAGNIFRQRWWAELPTFMTNYIFHLFFALYKSPFYREWLCPHSPSKQFCSSLMVQIKQFPSIKCLSNKELYTDVTVDHLPVLQWLLVIETERHAPKLTHGLLHLPYFSSDLTLQQGLCHHGSVYDWPETCLSSFFRVLFQCTWTG